MKVPSPHVPFEIVRTILAVSRTGSYTKAARFLGVSQPAITAQMKRAEMLMGGELFIKTVNGSTTTKLGALVLTQARKIIEANDQMLRLGGALQGPQPIRLGLSNLLVQEFLHQQSSESLSKTLVHTDSSSEITKGLMDGYHDIACFFETPSMSTETKRLIVAQRPETFVWARSKHFTVSPGSPIPILSWSGAVTDDMMINALVQHNISYRIAFKSFDYHAELSAAQCGIGLMIMPYRMIPSTLVHANESYLPPIPPVMTYLCVRSNRDSDHLKLLISNLTELFFSASVV